MNETIYQTFAEQVKAHPDAPAVIENHRVISFGQLSAMIDVIAASIPEGTKTVGIALEHRSELIAAIFAALKRGARYVPVETDFPSGRVRFIMEEAEAGFILAEQDHLHGIDAQVHKVDCLVCPHNAGKPNPPAPQNPDAAAYILYTSGTTGRPKGVCVTNRNVCHYARAFESEYHVGSGDIMLQYSPCTFDIFVEEVFAVLLNGGAVAIPTEDDRSSTETLMDFVRRHGVTMISGFPYLLAEMNNLAEIPGSLRLLISGGDVLRASYVDKLVPKVEVYNTYGPSETTVCATYYRCRDGAVLEDGTYPIGKAVQGASVRILRDNGQEAAPGETGEICIRGGGVSKGYIGNRIEENKAFVHEPDGTVTYRSGDLGYVLPDGNIAFLRRRDTQVMILGKRVEVAEVESQLYKCPNVKHAYVHAFTDENHLAYLVAYLVPAEGKIRVSDVVDTLSESLASFMIPEYFVSLTHIPLNASGKPDITQMPVVLKRSVRKAAS